MSPYRLLSLALDPARLLTARGLPPDPWQRSLLLSGERQVLLCCSRQAGKSTVVSALALHTALFRPGSLVLLLSPSLRQSAEIFRKVLEIDDAIGRPLSAPRRTQFRLEFSNGSRVLCLPGREDTLRGYGGVSLLVIDEAARVPDDLYRSVRPMLAVSRGRLVALSTPFGQRGWFWREWSGDGPWLRVRVNWRDCPRIRPEFIEEERRSLGEAWVAQEYETAFTALEGLVYPDFAAAVTDDDPPAVGRQIGGIDFGWRNPFAAVWGRLAPGDVLWITHERHKRRTPLYVHAAALRDAGSIVWHADPAGATEIEELRAAGLAVHPANNSIRAGIDAVSSRIQTGRLKVHRPGCGDLIREAGLYRYPGPGERVKDGEGPVDEHNHALAALRYLIAGLDARHMARLRRPVIDHPEPPPSDDHLWTTLR